MTFQVQKLISVMQWDGADRHYHEFYFRDSTTAEQYKKDVDKYCYYQEQSLIICDTIQDVKEWKNGDMKRKALAKLTKEEKEILGLKG